MREVTTGEIEELLSRDRKRIHVGVCSVYAYIAKRKSGSEIKTVVVYGEGSHRLGTYRTTTNTPEEIAEKVTKDIKEEYSEI